MKKFIALILLVALCLSMLSMVQAANVCSQISGNANATSTFTVNTGSRWLASDKITFTQTKGTYKYNTPFKYNATGTGYGQYFVYYKRSGDSEYTTKNWTTKTLTVSLKKNTTYEFEIVPKSAIESFFTSGKSVTGWKTPATWKCTNTKGINYCT